MKKDKKEMTVWQNGPRKVYRAVCHGVAVIQGVALAGLTKGTAFCTSNLFKNEVKVNMDGLSDSSQIIGNVLTIVGGVCTIIGFFMVASGIIKYLQAKNEDNASGESKAAMSMGIGAAFVVMPQILNVLFA